MEELKGTDANFQHPAKWLIPQGGWRRQREREKLTGKLCRSLRAVHFARGGHTTLFAVRMFSETLCKSSFTILI